jgi:hypothetical protein
MASLQLVLCIVALSGVAVSDHGEDGDASEGNVAYRPGELAVGTR